MIIIFVYSPKCVGTELSHIMYLLTLNTTKLKILAKINKQDIIGNKTDPFEELYNTVAHIGPRRLANEPVATRKPKSKPCSILPNTFEKSA